MAGGDAAPGLAARLRARARALGAELAVPARAERVPRTPLAARLLAALVVAYALSPIDLIPDPIPVLGQLDDLVLVPFGLWLAFRLVPTALLAEHRAAVAAGAAPPPLLGASRIGAAIVVGLWLAAAALVLRLVLPLLG